MHSRIRPAWNTTAQLVVVVAESTSEVIDFIQRLFYNVNRHTTHNHQLEMMQLPLLDVAYPSTVMALVWDKTPFRDSLRHLTKIVATWINWCWYTRHGVPTYGKHEVKFAQGTLQWPIRPHFLSVNTLMRAFPRPHAPGPKNVSTRENEGMFLLGWIS